MENVIRKKIIGIASRNIVNPLNNKQQVLVNEEYLNLLLKYGFVPFIIPYTGDTEAYLPLCDGFLIPGGYDIRPSYYGEENEACHGFHKEEVDELDKKIILYAERNGKPVLGICRGLQMINIVHGGTLIQNLGDSSHYKSLKEELIINGNSHFYKENEDKYIINSYHHQGIGKPGKGIIIEGTSNGVGELITHEKYPLIASQFHIERMTDDKITDIIMKYFISLFKEEE